MTMASSSLVGRSMSFKVVLFLTWLFLDSNVPLAGALFVLPPSKRVPYPDLKLASADHLGVKYTSFAKDAGKAASLPSFALSLNAEFLSIKDEATFLALQRAYCGWSETKTRVKWKPGRRYTLLDFLPPIMQAVSELHFQSSRTPQRGLPSFLPRDRKQRYSSLKSSQEVLLTSNCWGFAWEVLFQADNADVKAMTISTADPTSAWREFTGAGFDLIQSSRTQPELLTLSNRELRNRKLQAGDVLLIWHQNPPTYLGKDLYLDHVAICIDEDVYFEKSGSGDNVPFRVNTWEGVVKNFPTSIFFWEWRRLVRNNPLSPQVYGASAQTRVSPATDVFGVDAQLASSDKVDRDRFSPLLSRLQPKISKRISLQADVGDDGEIESQTYTGILVLEDILFDEPTGRAYLPRSSFTPEWYLKMQQMLLRS